MKTILKIPLLLLLIVWLFSCLWKVDNNQSSEVKNNNLIENVVDTQNIEINNDIKAPEERFTSIINEELWEE